MEYIFTYPKEKLDNSGGVPDSKDLMQLINKHKSVIVPGIVNLINYYMGEHAIQNSERPVSGGPNSKPVSNHAKDIADTASGYFMGSPISWKSKSNADISPLVEAFDHATVDDTDQENALWLSICGRAYEYVYQELDEVALLTKSLDPRNAFIVCDQSIEHKELFGVYYYQKKDDSGDSDDVTTYITVSTETSKYEYEVKGESSAPPVSNEQNVLGYIQIIEYKNNKFCIGDYEQQIGLIDAYNVLMADRVNDKQQFVDAILVIYGALLGGDSESTDEALDELKKKKLLELDNDARAEYLTSTLDEAGAETLRKAIQEDIYTFSHVPNLQDEHFAGNSSGVAMEYKLLGLEMLTKIKERWYRKAMRKRLRIFIGFLGYRQINIDETDLEAKFSRGLPKNLVEIAQMISNLSGKVSLKTLLTQIPFVEDPEAEVALLNQEQEEAVMRQQQLFAAQQQVFDATANTPPEKKNDEEEEKKKPGDEVDDE